MRVLIVGDSDDRYGASRSLIVLVKNLKEKYGKEIDVTVLLPKAAQAIKEDINNAGAKTFVLRFSPMQQGTPDNPFKFIPKYFIRGIEYLYGIKKTIKVVDRYVDFSDIDIIHSNSSRDDFGAMLSEIYNKPLVWHIREFGDKDFGVYSYRKNYIKYMNKVADRFVCVSDAVRTEWGRKGLDLNKCIVIYNGVEIPKQRMHRDKNDKIRMVMLGNMCEAKGQDNLLQALGHLDLEQRNDIRLDFIGDSTETYYRKMKRTIEKYELSNVVSFRGYIKNANEELFNYDIGVVCSKSEGFGRVTAEYMAAGLPVIASDTGANAELIRNGENGYLYRASSMDSLKNVIVSVLKNKNLLESMGNSAYKFAYSYFSEQRYAEKVFDQYVEVIDNLCI